MPVHTVKMSVLALQRIRSFLFQDIPVRLNRELEVPHELCPKSLLLSAFSIIITMDFYKNVRIRLQQVCLPMWYLAVALTAEK